jgi:hypothetical protein
MAEVLEQILVTHFQTNKKSRPSCIVQQNGALSACVNPTVDLRCGMHERPLFPLIGSIRY